jgi:hypothetical protein
MRPTIGRHLPALALAFALCAACGYKPVSGGSTGPGSISKVAVPVARNETAFAGAAAPFTDEVRRQLSALGVEVVAQGGGAPVLSMVITAIGDETGMTMRSGGTLLPSDTVWRIEVMVSLESADGQSIVAPTRFSGDGRSITSGSVAGESYTGSRTQREVMDDLAARIAAMVVMLQ